MGDAGLTGRKIIVDTYGGIARHGGGAFSRQGPDEGRPLGGVRGALRGEEHRRGGPGGPRASCSSRTRSASRSRRRCRSRRSARDASTTTRILELVHEHFDLRPAAIIRDLNLRRPIYRATAAYGHFGRDDIDAPWERTDKADVLACRRRAPRVPAK